MSAGARDRGLAARVSVDACAEYGRGFQLVRWREVADAGAESMLVAFSVVAVMVVLAMIWKLGRTVNRGVLWRWR